MPALPCRTWNYTAPGVKFEGNDLLSQLGGTVLQDNIKQQLDKGYQMAGIFHQSGYKFGRWYDVAWMEKMLGEHEEPPAAVRDFHGID